ncbi:hypothetical protein ACI2JA_09060 [Alkalihalobacillus sp. NPDC078783]
MDKQRREIIINEIHYWQKTKLLPEQQCHYLLALYSEGEDELPKPREPKRVTMVLFMIFTQFCFLASVFILYFTDFESRLQIGIIFMLFFLTIFTWFKRRNHAIESVFHMLMLTMILFILLLYYSFTMWSEIPSQAVIILFTGIWFWLGWRKKQKVFYFVATFMLLLTMIIFFFYQ